jgi:hypothetical protein
MSTGNTAGLLANVAMAFAIWAVLYFGNYRPNRHLLTVMSDKERLDRAIDTCWRFFVAALVATTAGSVAMGYFVYLALDVPTPISSTPEEKFVMWMLFVSVVVMMLAGLRRSSLLARRHRQFVREFEG